MTRLTDLPPCDPGSPAHTRSALASHARPTVARHRAALTPFVTFPPITLSGFPPGTRLKPGQIGAARRDGEFTPHRPCKEAGSVSHRYSNYFRHFGESPRVLSPTYSGVTFNEKRKLSCVKTLQNNFVTI